MTTTRMPKKIVTKSIKVTKSKKNENCVINIVGNKLWVLAEEQSGELGDTLSIHNFEKPLKIEWLKNRNELIKVLLSDFNLLKNGTFGDSEGKSISGWNIDVTEPASAQVDLSEEWHLKDGHTAFLLAPTQADRPRFNAQHKIPVVDDASMDYHFSGFFATHRAGGKVCIDFYNANDKKIGEEIITIPLSLKYGGGQSLDSYTYIESLFTPAEEAQYIIFSVELGEQEDFSEMHSSIFFTDLCLCFNKNNKQVTLLSDGAEKLNNYIFEHKYNKYGYVSLPRAQQIYKETIIKARICNGDYINININRELETIKLLNSFNISEIQYGIDHCFFVTDSIIFISGWKVKQNSKVFIAATSDFDTKVFSFPRHDLKIDVDQKTLEQAGFFCFITADEKLKENIIELEFNTNDGDVLYIDYKIDKKNDTKETSQKILSFIDIKKGFRQIFEDALGEVMQAMWKDHCNKSTITPTLTRYGKTPKKPKLSIIVPLYGRIDFMEHQTSTFSIDKSFRGDIELIYVLDDPDKFYDVIDPISKDLYQLNQVPFKVVKYDENLGYAKANNIGVRFATSDMVLLLNSDVFPQEPLWADKLLDIYKTLENPGVLGCKLLFEDGSIQHAGMEFKRNEGLDNLWTNVHPYKGLPDINKSFVVNEVPAVTGACMLLKKENYLAVGGFDEKYILGDFEDSDLCLKLIEKGLKVYFSSEPQLYHLERQSQSLFDDHTWKFKITVFNCWQHSLKWDEKIETLMEQSHG